MIETSQWGKECSYADEIRESEHQGENGDHFNASIASALVVDLFSEGYIFSASSVEKRSLIGALEFSREAPDAVFLIAASNKTACFLDTWDMDLSQIDRSPYNIVYTQCKRWIA